ncbi:MAG: hypothetical protein ACOVOR_01060 [Rhabdochlamydiaceae bacterium]
MPCQKGKLLLITNCQEDRDGCDFFLKDTLLNQDFLKNLPSEISILHVDFSIQELSDPNIFPFKSLYSLASFPKMILLDEQNRAIGEWPYCSLSPFEWGVDVSVKWKEKKDLNFASPKQLPLVDLEGDLKNIPRNLKISLTQNKKVFFLKGNIFSNLIELAQKNKQDQESISSLLKFLKKSKRQNLSNVCQTRKIIAEYLVAQGHLEQGIKYAQKMHASAPEIFKKEALDVFLKIAESSSCDSSQDVAKRQSEQGEEGFRK